ncbi:GTP-binding protein [Mariprofundus sp. EBB-1]|uniref:Rab family GTPase n=1 Tax=Mariprofundus sp. EBB-1 TaxID=2650971 RepID=UPI000EF1BA59|nr:Rab family GTPase [Mariprofundus sp. EBB-1]RLL54757.1 GTP-binding protein [Mariprofundus sp. EBB-1]
MSRVLQKKVCLLGSFAVGKTSLVGRFVKGIFSDKYLSTMGVKIDRKSLQLDDVTVNMMLWDVHGEESNKKVPAAYMRGSAAYLLVIDGTRIASVEAARELHARMKAEVGDVPFVVLLNKVDLQDEWQLSDTDVTAMHDDGWKCYKTSALSGENVEEAFSCLARQLAS